MGKRQAGAEIEVTPEMVEAVKSELLGLNFEFESEADAAWRICAAIVDVMASPMELCS